MLSAIYFYCSGTIELVRWNSEENFAIIFANADCLSNPGIIKYDIGQKWLS